jgi:hypothetical protein
VDTAPDGSTVIRIHELTDADGLEAALADLGVTADVEYAGSGSTVTVDQDGQVTAGEDVPLPEGGTLKDPKPMDSTITFGSADPGSGAAACGLTTAGVPPIDLKRDGDDFVITLAGPTLTEGNSLQLSTVTGDSWKSLVASYRFGDATCGAMVSL